MKCTKSQVLAIVIGAITVLSAVSGFIIYLLNDHIRLSAVSVKLDQVTEMMEALDRKCIPEKVQDLEYRLRKLQEAVPAAPESERPGTEPAKAYLYIDKEYEVRRGLFGARFKREFKAPPDAEIVDAQVNSIAGWSGGDAYVASQNEDRVVVEGWTNLFNSVKYHVKIWARGCPPEQTDGQGP